MAARRYSPLTGNPFGPCFTLCQTVTAMLVHNLLDAIFPYLPHSAWLGRSKRRDTYTYTFAAYCWTILCVLKKDALYAMDCRMILIHLSRSQ